MWTKTANAILRALDSDAPSAASLEVARKFLADQGTTLDALRQWTANPLGFNPSDLPKFGPDDEDDPGAPAEADDALRRVPPFEDSDSND